MLVVAGFALWQGGWVFRALVVAVGLGVLWEFWGLVRRITPGVPVRALWMAGGIAYIGAACISLLNLDAVFLIIPIGAVIGTDVGAYFAGRLIGGPKIAPAISPSKTWSGLFGGMLGATIVLALIMVSMTVFSFSQFLSAIPFVAKVGAPLAVVAQAGDFFESWMKRRAGVKDSGTLIPGHGGLFDRVDGLLPVLIVVSIFIKWLMIGAKI
nr:phosphatidate cytidylyltransferase [Sphingobium subterraneum]